MGNHDFHGKTHYFYGHFQVRKLLVYQRVMVITIQAIHYPPGYSPDIPTMVDEFRGLFIAYPDNHHHGINNGG